MRRSFLLASIHIAVLLVPAPAEAWRGVGLRRVDLEIGDVPCSIAAGDLDGDGHLDIAAATCPGDLRILFGNGDGTFRAPAIYPAGSEPLCIVAADVTNDGWRDLVVANAGENSFTVRLGTGGGAFGPRVDFATLNTPVWVSVVDMNRDGWPDVVVANRGSNTVQIARGNGLGAFVTTNNLGAGIGPSAVSGVDLNQDGRPDLISGYGSDFYGAQGGAYVYASVPCTGAATSYGGSNPVTGAGCVGGVGSQCDIADPYPPAYLTAEGCFSPGGRAALYPGGGIGDGTLLLVSTQPANVALPGGCALLVQAPFPIVVVGGSFSDCLNKVYGVCTKQSAGGADAFVISYEICQNSLAGVQGAWFSELFATKTRTAGASLAYQISAVVSGFTPMIATALYGQFEWMGPALLFSGYGVLGLVAAILTRETWGPEQKAEVAALDRAATGKEEQVV